MRRAMKKTSNKILGTLLIIVILIGLAGTIAIKILGNNTYTKKANLSISDNYIEVRFNHQTTENDMQDLKIRLKKEKNIDIDFSESKFDRKGNLNVLNINIDCNDGCTGNIKAQGSPLHAGRYGFSRTYFSEEEDSFRVGKIFPPLLD